VLFVLGSAALTPARRLVAQDLGITLWDVGSQRISGTSWEFDGDFAINAGAWESLTVSNSSYCWVGPNDPHAGTAHAGAVWWFTELTTNPQGGGDMVYTGSLRGERSADVGQATITTTDDGTNAVTHVQITISGSDLMYYQDNTLEVCLLGSS